MSPLDIVPLNPALTASRGKKGASNSNGDSKSRRRLWSKNGSLTSVGGFGWCVLPRIATGCWLAGADQAALRMRRVLLRSPANCPPAALRSTRREMKEAITLLINRPGAGVAARTPQRRGLPRGRRFVCLLLCDDLLRDAARRPASKK